MQYARWTNSEEMPNSPLQLNSSAALQFHCLQMLYTHFTQGKPDISRSHQPDCLPVFKAKEQRKHFLEKLQYGK